MLFSACLLYLVCCCPSVSLVLQSSGQVPFCIFYILYYTSVGRLVVWLVAYLNTGWLLVLLVDLSNILLSFCEMQCIHRLLIHFLYHLSFSLLSLCTLCSVGFWLSFQIITLFVFSLQLSLCYLLAVLLDHVHLPIHFIKH